MAFSFIAFGPEDHGVGGGVVVCKPSSLNAFNGRYSLDYLLTYQETSTDLVEVTNFENSFDRLERLFAEKLPELSETFIDFRRTLKNTDSSKKRVWIEAPFGVHPVSTSTFTNALPQNCREGNTLNLIQVVVREFPEFSGAPARNIVYKYVPAVYEELKVEKPLHLSFLLLHEWLWDHSLNVERNMKVNRFFHSHALERLSREELIAQLQGMGFLLPSAPLDGFDPNFCPQESGAGTWWRERLSHLGVTGRFTWAARDKQCLHSHELKEGSECTLWRNKSSKWNSLIGPRRGITIERNGRIELFSNAAGYTVHARCNFTAEGRVNCTPFLDPEQKPYLFGRYILPDGVPGISSNPNSRELELIGHLGKDCLNLKGQGWISGEQTGLVNGTWLVDAEVSVSASIRP